MSNCTSFVQEGEVVEVPAILEKTKEELEDEELQEMDKKISDLQVRTFIIVIYWFLNLFMRAVLMLIAS